jgi:hypothetical protein
MSVVTRLWQCLPDRAPKLNANVFETGLTKPLRILYSRHSKSSANLFLAAGREDDSLLLKAEFSLLRGCPVADDSGVIGTIFLARI